MSQPHPDVQRAYARGAGVEMLWIFGLSMLHNVALMMYGVIMMLALGVQVLLNNHLISAAKAEGKLASIPLVLGLDALVALPFLVGGILALKGVRAVILPVLILYAADTLVVGYLVVQFPKDLMMMLMLAFHGYMCFLLYGRMKAAKAGQVPAAL